ncbi:MULTISPECIES: sodium:solute symporter family transporter [Sphingobacterium]|uniref:Na+/glucose cotransporter n=1 Tax=Sphingobacterium athyrii TaxID=2152717 RepID=A0A363NS75_9SPHI|nr:MULTISPECIES: sodium/solute symporter [Sphingobacterium]PUV23570.1 Na+/glucose cotransporter [Sphingobacterium athyrii]QIH36408.1 sodium/solute symporter [Sphingobacterium sp. DR205]
MNSILDKLTIYDYCIVVVYLVALLAIGIISSRKKTEGAEHFLAGKSLNWYSIGFNMWATNVGPSMLLAFATVGYTTGIVAVNFDWYAFIYLFLLAVLFAPRYIATGVRTLPEFMGKRFGPNTQTILAWYSLVKMLISWLSLGLFAGGFLVRQILGIQMWQSVTVLVALAGLFAYTGGLRTVAKINIFQMILLIAVSAFLTFLGLSKIGGISSLMQQTPDNYWSLIRPASDPDYPWYAIALGYPVAAIAFFCTDQAMVQSVLGAKNLEQGQLGINFIAWLKILSLPLFILTGIICSVLFPGLKDPSLAYMTMVTNLFPTGLNGLVIVVLIAVLVGTIGSSLNSLSTVFTMDIYLKHIRPDATNKQITQIGRYTVIIGCLASVFVALAIDQIKGLNLFDVFQSILGFIAPPLAVAFLMAVLWKRTNRAAINTILTFGAVLSLATGVCYLWIFPKDVYSFWPHYLMLSFGLFTALLLIGIAVSLLVPKSRYELEHKDSFQIKIEKPTVRVKAAWIALFIVMIALYMFFK